MSYLKPDGRITMSALIDSMAFFGQVPWHGLGVRLEGDDLMDVRRAQTAAGMNWEVGLRPVFTTNDLGDMVKVPEQYMFRKDNGKLLGCVGPRYTPLQNTDAFDWFQPFLDKGLAAIHTCGSLDEGRKVWVLAQIGGDNLEIRAGDEVCKFLMLSNSHDGTRAVAVGLTPIRIVCANTLGMALTSKASKLIRVRHNRDVKTNVDNLRDIIDLANQEFVATAEQYRKLANKGINQADLVKYVKICLDVKPDVANSDLHTRTLNTITEIVKQFEKESPIAGNTYWNAYNAVNHYRVWAQGRNSDNRLNTLWFGPNQAKDVKALELALEMAA